MIKQLVPFLFFFSIILFTSCDDSTDASSSDLIGTWTLQNYKVSMAGSSLDPVDVSDQNYTLKFNDNGTFEGFLMNYSGPGTTKTGKFSESGNTLTLTENNGTSTEYTYSVKGSALQIKLIDEVLYYIIEMNYRKSTHN